jgi:hypothetical protein
MRDATQAELIRIFVANASQDASEPQLLDTGSLDGWTLD